MNCDKESILLQFANRLERGGGLYLNFQDSIKFVELLEKKKIPIFRIELLKITSVTTESSLNKIMDFQYNNFKDYQTSKISYKNAIFFLLTEMNPAWNYAEFY